MATKVPLKFEFDVKTPSSIAEFTTSDVVGVENGGTGVSSLALLGIALSSIDVSSASVSATTISSPTFTGGTFTGTTITGATITGASVSATTVKGSLIFGNDLIEGSSIKGISVSATAVSGTTFNGMSYPPPFGYAQLDSDGTASDSEQNLGVGSTIASIVSDSDDITWNDTNKNFEVSSAGIYELNSLVVLNVAATTNVTIKAMMKRGLIASVENSADSRVHSSIDPTETSIRAVVDCLAADVLYITTVDDGTTDITPITGSSIMVKRLQ